jgi:fido (protein-threonine AMPylation protein)
MSDLYTLASGATPFDADGLINPDIKTKKDLDEAEATGILHARTKHLRTARKSGWFSPEYIRRVHRDMFHGIWSWAGQYRNKDVKLNLGAEFYQIPCALKSFVGTLPSGQTQRKIRLLSSSKLCAFITGWW